MEQRLHFLTLGVTDLGRSRDFYVEGLGWRPTLDLAEVVFLQVAPGVLLGLWPVDELGHDAGVAMAPGPTMAMAQNLDSREAVDAAVERARGAGAMVTREPRETSYGGYAGYVADPDGHLWELAWNPGWRVLDDGTVELESPG